ncbi:helix-turn-helix domain-containing protein [Comamonas aquatica]|jgi:predicted DNA-binding transcriptional regulator AlpA|nr:MULTISPECIES: helix-turn-helix domain-containing protein [Betaproteobacteria]MDH1903475.1 helix-turn-helix domain-containing protein [Comamonas aquatica]WBM43803.1 helix-turn-helix domain-containing protein [Comamonas aquatica]
MFKAPVPAKLPHLHSILDNIGLPDHQVARFLGVTKKTVHRWRKNGQAPRPVMLALFWETTWGQSAADCNAINQARMNYMHAKVLERQIKQMQANIDRLQRKLDETPTGAANSPIYDVR